MTESVGALKAPRVIYLQCDDPAEFTTQRDWNETTWCADQINDSDIAYRLASEPYLPDELVVSIRQVLSYASNGVVEHDASILRDILVAVEREA